MPCRIGWPSGGRLPYYISYWILLTWTRLFSCTTAAVLPLPKFTTFTGSNLVWPVVGANYVTIYFMSSLDKSWLKLMLPWWKNSWFISACISWFRSYISPSAGTAPNLSLGLIWSSASINDRHAGSIGYLGQLICLLYILFHTANLSVPGNAG